MNLLGLLDKATSLATKSHLIVFGDFNYPEIDHSFSVVNGGSGTDAHAFFSKINDLFLHQNINDCTRHRNGQQPSLLDCVFTDEDNVIDGIQFLAPLGKSDHVCIELNYIRGQQVNEMSHTKFNYWKGDYAGIKKELQCIDWDKQLEHKGVDESWVYFHSKLSALTEKYVPLKKVPSKQTKPVNEWITKNTKSEIKKRDALWAKYKKYSSEQNYKAYKAVRNRVIRYIKDDKLRYHRKLAGQFRSNPKRFYSYVRRHQTVKDRIMSLKTPDGQLTENDQATADVLCNFFSSVFTHEGDWTEDAVSPPSVDIELGITEEKVSQYLKALKSDKSPGPDSIHPLLLQNVADEVAKPLTLIFTKSLNESKLPEDWRRANITAIYKKGARNEASNYRPVSLTSVVCKILEAIIKEKLTRFLQDKQWIVNEQHGFVSGGSCLTNLFKV